MSQLSARSEAITRRTYTRPLDDDGTKFERWGDVIERSHVSHHRRLWEEAGGVPDEAELGELRELGIERKGTVSGRTLWLGGTEYAYTRSASQYNCSALNLCTVFDMVDAFWLLLNGCGVGGKPQSGTLHGYYQRIPQLEIVPSERDKGYRGRKYNIETLPDAGNGYTWTIDVGDSAEAWSKSFGKMLVSPRRRVDRLRLVFSEVRGPGGRLKGYGWICNGFQPLATAATAVHAILNRTAGNLLSEEDIGDIFNWMGTVLSSRRAAEALVMDQFHPLVNEFATRKKDYWLTGNDQRRQSNNSILFWRRPSVDDIADLLTLNLNGGEPGFVNATAALHRCPWFQNFNPSLRRGTKVATTAGVVPIEELQDKIFQVYNLDGKVSPAFCRLSGRDKPLYEITLTGGHTYYATAEHEWPVYLNGRHIKVKTADLHTGDTLPTTPLDKLFDGTIGDYADGFFLGWMMGDGWVTRRSDNGQIQVGMVVGEDDRESGVKDVLVDYLRKNGCEAEFRPSTNGKSEEMNTVNSRLTAILGRYGYQQDKQAIPTAAWKEGTEEFRKGLVDGLFSSDGFITPPDANGRNRYIGISSSREGLIREVSELLGFYGIKTNVRVHVGDGQFPNGKDYGKQYTSYRLLVNDFRSVSRFAALFKLTHVRKQAALDDATKRDTDRRLRSDHGIAVQSVVLTDMTEDVWDIGVFADDHCFRLAHCVTGNCFEIILPSHGFCNLVSVSVPHFGRDFTSLERAVYVMARANYRQTCVNLEDGMLQPRWHQTNESLRLCGVSLTGIVQASWLTDYQIRRLRNAAVSGAYSMADELGLPRPKAITTVKPEGTRSKISGTVDREIGEGMHAPLGRHIFNWINFSTKDPLVVALEAAGYKTLPNPSDVNNVLVRFPVEYSGCGFKTVDGRQVNTETAIDQLERYKRWNTLWADHNVSATVSLTPDEVPDVSRWLHANWDSCYVATAFLRRTDPTLTPADIGQPYLPQEVVTEDVFRAAQSDLKPVDWDRFHTGLYDIDEAGCAGGVCPVK